eukprot:353214-Chlamydomonas_euryale.AAC.1
MRASGRSTALAARARACCPTIAPLTTPPGQPSPRGRRTSARWCGTRTRTRAAAACPPGAAWCHPPARGAGGREGRSRGYLYAEG